MTVNTVLAGLICTLRSEHEPIHSLFKACCSSAVNSDVNVAVSEHLEEVDVKDGGRDTTMSHFSESGKEHSS